MDAAVQGLAGGAGSGRWRKGLTRRSGAIASGGGGLIEEREFRPVDLREHESVRVSLADDGVDQNLEEEKYRN